MGAAVVVVGLAVVVAGADVVGLAVVVEPPEELVVVGIGALVVVGLTVTITGVRDLGHGSGSGHSGALGGIA